MKRFTVQDFVELAQSVYAGYPKEQAQKILEAQRELDETNIAEQQYWLTLKKLRSEKTMMESTTIRVFSSTKQMLNEIKTNSSESYDSVINRLIENLIKSKEREPTEIRSLEENSEQKENQDD